MEDVVWGRGEEGGLEGFVGQVGEGDGAEAVEEFEGGEAGGGSAAGGEGEEDRRGGGVTEVGFGFWEGC